MPRTRQLVPGAAKDIPHTYVRALPSSWRDGFEFAYMRADPKADEGPGLTWRQLTPRHWSGTWGTKIRGTVTRDGDGWVAYLRLETHLACRRSQRWDGSAPSMRRRSPPTRCGRPGNGGRVRRDLYVSGSDR
jgi:hypothetical protein